MIVTNLIEDSLPDPHFVSFAEDIKKGLNAHPKTISSKYFYDDRGSKIFQEITKLEEYYPTRSELEIIQTMKDILPDIVGRDEIDIVELGVGDGHKTKILIESFLSKKIKVNFYPIDISAEAIHQLEDNIADVANLRIHAIVAEYIEGLRFARNNSCNRQVVLFLGANIGNFSRAESEEMLKKMKSEMNEDDFLLIGFDLKKNIEFMTEAYSDKKGVTAQFNLNLLERINKELGGKFDPDYFKHQALYNPALGAMESYLISLKDQDIYIAALNQFIHFDEYEPIHLEYSFKYLEKEIVEMSAESGFTHVTSFSDTNHYFVDSLWQV